MKVTIEIETLEDIDYLITIFGPGCVSRSRGQIREDVRWSTWIENKKRELKLSWTEFSERCDIDVTTVWRYRTQGYEPSARSIVRMIEAFGA